MGAKCPTLLTLLDMIILTNFSLSFCHTSLVNSNISSAHRIRNTIITEGAKGPTALAPQKKIIARSRCASHKQSYLE
jgi:hypothetical protein